MIFVFGLESKGVKRFTNKLQRKTPINSISATYCNVALQPIEFNKVPMILTMINWPKPVPETAIPRANPRRVVKYCPTKLMPLEYTKLYPIPTITPCDKYKCHNSVLYDAANKPAANIIPPGIIIVRFPTIKNNNKLIS